MLFYSFRSTLRQWKRSLLVILIVAIAVGTYLTLSSAMQSFTTLLATTGEPENVVLLPTGGFGERWPEVSHISPDVAGGLREIEGVASNAKGEKLISPEVMLTSLVHHRGKKIRVSVRGVDQRAFEVHQSVVGTTPTEGVIIGSSLKKLMDPIAVGDTIRVADREWRVAGFFAPRGKQTQYDSEIWAPLEDVMHSRNMRDYSFVTLRASSREHARELGARINDVVTAKASATLLGEVHAVPEISLADSSITVREAFQVMYLILSTLVLIVAGLGTLNVLLQTVLRRRRHMALFRAMGFSFSQLAGSFVIEGAAVALVGSLVGVLLTMPFRNSVFVLGSVARPGVTVVALQFTVNDVLTAIALGTFLGAVCSLLPAIYSTRFDVKSELRVD